MKVRFSDIVWEDDVENDDLPSTFEMEVFDVDLDSDGADFLSDLFDGCVLSFKYEIIS